MIELSHVPVADQGIPALPQVLDPRELIQYLGFFSLPPWQWGPCRDACVQVLKCHPGSRCTLQITLHADNVHVLIGKVYASDGITIYEAMKRISNCGFGPKAEFSIPRPLAFLPELHLLLQESVPGRVAQEFFLNGDERDRGVAAERCGRWLARFHAVAPKVGPVFDLETYLTSLERWAVRIGEAGEPLAAKAACLFHRLAHTRLALGSFEPCAGHGSYCSTQIMLADGRTTTFDWDGQDVADPSRDVARFVISLRRLALGCLGSIRALDGAADAFLKTYAAVSQAEVKHLPFYQAAICIKLAKYEISKGLNHRRLRIMEAMLDEGLRVL